MFKIGFIFIVLQSLCFFGQIYGHGYLADPPARSSAWMFDQDFSKCCKYYNHLEMSCGGTDHQWRVNKGKCSICGERYDSKTKLFGVGDSMYLGKIVRTYTQGDTIPVTVVLTANHLGTFEFRVCNIDKDPSKDATQMCLDLNLLKTTKGLTNYAVQRSFTTVIVNVTLPADLVCKHCVFQWKYRTGNSWGSSDGRSCLGCGKENEEFYGCSDIAIVSSKELAANEPSAANEPLAPIDSIVTIPTTTNEVMKKATAPPPPPRKCTSAIVFSQSFDLTSIMEQYCQKICPNDCPADKMVDNEILYGGCVNSCKKLCACE